MDGFYGNHLKSVSPFSADDNKICCLHNYDSLDFLNFFLFLHHSLETPEKVICEIPSRLAVFQTLRPARLAPTTLFKVSSIPNLPHRLNALWLSVLVLKDLSFFYTFSVITRMVLIWKLLLIVLIGPFSLEDSFWHALYVCVYVQSVTWTSEQPLSFLLLLFSEHYNHTKLQSEHPDWTNYKLNQLRFNLIKSSRCLEGLNGKSPNCTTAHYLGSNQLN